MATKKKRATPALDPSFYAKKPISVWNRPLQLDAKGLFGALAKGALHSFTGQWTELGGDTVDGLSALGIDSRDAPQLSWLLLRRALTSAMADLIQESLPEIGESKKDLEEVSRRLDETLESEEVAVDRSLFDRPRDLPLLGVIQKPFAQWLEVYGLEPAEAASVAGRLPSYFVLALHTEWRNSPATYEPIREAVDTPFTRAAERERAWNAYAARLERQVDESMFGESFGLRQVYVPLRAFYEMEAESEKAHALTQKRGILSAVGTTKIGVRLEREVDAWIGTSDRDDGYRVVSGGPGSGKSAFSRMYAVRNARERRMRTLLIPLHQLNVSRSFKEAVAEYTQLLGLSLNPIDLTTGEDCILLILDGLDELSLQGRSGAEAAREFAREVLKTIEIINQDRRRLLVLFTGREPIIQASESVFRERRRVLNVLPYCVESSQQRLLCSSMAGLLVERQEYFWEEDQRPLWWQLYGHASGRGYTDLPEELQRPELDEITAQPLLNSLVALSYDRGQLNFSDDFNLNDIYEDLLEAVYERSYERNRPLLRNLNLREFRRILEEIALAAWHGLGRTASLMEIESYCKSAGLYNLLERFNGPKIGVENMLVAFYFRQFGQTHIGEPTFEFTHKSFRDYLTACRIIRSLERIEHETELCRRTFDSGWDERTALRHWAEICGPARMEIEIWSFIHREVQRRGLENAQRWQMLLAQLASAMLSHGMPMESISPGLLTFHQQTRRARNAEEALLSVLNACARVTRDQSRIDWSKHDTDDGGKTALGNMIKRLQGQRARGAQSTLALQFLSFLDLSGQALHSADLYGANLERTNLSMANLRGANLEEANLQEANLEQANLEWAHMEWARLDGANLEGACLRGARVFSSQLEKTHGKWIR